MKTTSLKNRLSKGTALFAIFGLMMVGGASSASAMETLDGNAYIQIIHNASDPAAAEVDIYLNGELLLDDFAFRTATPYVEVSANLELQIGVAPGTSTGPDDILVTVPLTLNEDEYYVAIANGVLDPMSFEANPDGRDIAFELFLKTDARNEGMDPGMVDFFALHGATDAPTVDVIARDVATLVDDAAYGDITGYLSVPAADYVLDVTPGSDNDTVVASFSAPLSGLGGGAAVVFASGFLVPENNQSGAPFGLFAALADGTVIELPALTTARVQIIHNAADPAAAEVDIYLGDTLTLDDFAFRAATPYIDFPANQAVSIGVAPGTSTGPGDIIASFDVNLLAAETFVVVANGVLDPMSFEENPDGRDIAFTLFAKADAREAGMDPGMVDFFALHGATDAPTVDVIARDVATLVDDAAYGDITGYLSVPAADYVLDVTPGSDNDTVVASFSAPLSGLGGGAAVVFASGFLVPENNQSGAPFGLFAALADGTVIELPALTTARVQIIHNAADPAAAEVDIYLGDTLTLDDFAFRAATPYIDFPANQAVSIGVAPGTSTGPGDIIASFDVNLLAAETFVVVANGVLDPSMFDPNPDGRDIAFTLWVKEDAREMAMDPATIDLFVVHGITDAPTVDAVVVPDLTLVDGAAYGDITGYLTVDPKIYLMALTDDDQTAVLGKYRVPLSNLAGGSAVVFASGLVNTRDENGPRSSFTVLAALPDGTVVDLAKANSMDFVGPFLEGGSPLGGQGKSDGGNYLSEQPAGNGPFELSDNELASNEVTYRTALTGTYPSVVKRQATVAFRLASEQRVSLSVQDVSGRTVARIVDGVLEGGDHSVRWDVGNVSNGVYFYRFSSDDARETRKVIVSR